MNSKIQQLDLDELQRRISAWEREYGMTSAECEQRYFNGDLGDSQSIIRWIHDYHSYKILLKNLKQEKVASGRKLLTTISPLSHVSSKSTRA